MFANRYVRTVVLSRVMLQLAIWIRNFAVLLYVTELTNHNPFYVSVISVAEFAPIFLFALIGGTFADRWQPKRTMVASDLLAALSAAAVLIAVWNGSWVSLLIGMFVSASLSQFSQPSAMKLYKRHVPEEQLPGVMSISQTMVALFTVMGPAIGTFIFVQFGIRVSLLLTMIFFLGSALVLMTLPRDEAGEGAARKGAFWAELLEGLHYIRSNPALRVLSMTFAITGLAAGLIQPLAIFIVIEKLGRDTSFLQWVLMVNGAAMLAGGIGIMKAARKVQPQMLLAAGLLVSAISTVLVGSSTIVWWTLLLQAASGLFYPCVQAGIQTLIMKNTNGTVIGRVSGTITPMFMGMMVAGMLISGLFKDSFSLTAVYVASGILLMTGIGVLSPLLKPGAQKAGQR